MSESTLLYDTISKINGHLLSLSFLFFSVGRGSLFAEGRARLRPKRAIFDAR